MTEILPARRTSPRRWSATSWRDPASWLGPAITLAILFLVVVVRPIVPVSSPGIPLLVTITLDSAGRIQSTNPAAGRMFGYEAGALLGRRIEDLLAPSIREPIAQARRRYLDTGQRQMSWTNAQLTGCRADGSEFPLEVSF